MKIDEVWNAIEANIANGHKVASAKVDFAAGVRAVAVEALTHMKDILNDEDSGRLYARLMATADRIER